MANPREWSHVISMLNGFTPDIAGYKKELRTSEKPVVFP
jgi:hypothetical protein